MAKRNTPGTSTGGRGTSRKPAATAAPAIPAASPAPAAAPAVSTPVRNTPIPKASAPIPAAPAPAKKDILVTHEMIARRAYEISQSPFGGSAEDNWFRAERELRGVV